MKTISKKHTFSFSELISLIHKRDIPVLAHEQIKNTAGMPILICLHVLIIQKIALKTRCFNQRMFTSMFDLPPIEDKQSKAFT